MIKNWKFFWAVFLLCALAEGLSFTAFFHPALHIWVMAIIGIAVLAASLIDLRYGLFVVMTELVIGSQGYLFFIDSQGSRLSLRIMLWIIVMGVWATKEILAVMRRQRVFEKYRRFPYFYQLAALAGIILLGLLVGRLAHNDSNYFFLEGKRWLYCLVFLPFILEIRKPEDLSKLWQLTLAGATWLSIKSLALIYILSHAFTPLMFNLYDWSRLMLLGEITRLPGGFSRVFIQSQVFLLPFFFFVFAKLLVKEERGERGHGNAYWIAGRWCLLGLVASVIIASLSRSFWAGSIAALVCALAYALIKSKLRFKAVSRYFFLGLVSVVLGLAIIFVVARFPYPNPAIELDADLFKDRASQMEAGAASRWSLLPVMGREIIKSPLWGFGFGKSLTYITSDPRVVASTTDGRYTTYAFEWGWLDIALKVGLLGVAAYIWLLWSVAKDGWKYMKMEPSYGLIVAMSVVALAAVHFFTPYLNHPLGFGYLVLIMLTLAIKNRPEEARG